MNHHLDYAVAERSQGRWLLAAVVAVIPVVFVAVTMLIGDQVLSAGKVNGIFTPVTIVWMSAGATFLLAVVLPKHAVFFLLEAGYFLLLIPVLFFESLIMTFVVLRYTL